MATDWPERVSAMERVTKLMLFFIPQANPGYESKMHLIKEWLIEFDDDGHPDREMGLDINGRVVIAGPSDTDYGFWLDTNMKAEDFDGETVPQETFEALWVGTRN